MDHGILIKINVIMQILLFLGMLDMMELSLNLSLIKHIWIKRVWIYVSLFNCYDLVWEISLKMVVDIFLII